MNELQIIIYGNVAVKQGFGWAGLADVDRIPKSACLCKCIYRKFLRY